MKNRTVLCIEDDRFIGEMYVRSLQKAGYSVDWMIDGNDGLVAAQNKKYDIILLDIMLPEKRGTEILDTLRGDEDLVPNSKIIVITNFEQSLDLKEDMESKADAYLVKAEITPRKLLRILERMFDGED